jgi:hypothetical protein
MIKSVQYTCIGSEANDGINTEIYFPCASGMVIIDTLVNGKSKNLDVNNETGFVLVTELLGRGDLVQIIYKTLPRNASISGGGGGGEVPTSLIDFIDEDFESTDFT